MKAATNQLQKSPYVDALLYEYLEEIHVFTLANVLRRPIIVLGEPFTYGRAGDSIEQNNFVGIYLPLLWTPESCYSMPVVVAFIVDHFQPLLGRAKSSLSSEEQTTVDAVPLVTRNLEPLRIHFLLPGEQGNVANYLLQQYLRTCEVEFSSDGGEKQMVLCAYLYSRDEDKYVHNLLDSLESVGQPPHATSTQALQYQSHRSRSHQSTPSSSLIVHVPGKWETCYCWCVMTNAPYTCIITGLVLGSTAA